MGSGLRCNSCATVPQAHLSYECQFSLWLLSFWSSFLICLEGQWKMFQLLGSIPSLWDTRTEFLASSFSLASGMIVPTPVMSAPHNRVGKLPQTSNCFSTSRICLPGWISKLEWMRFLCPNCPQVLASSPLLWLREGRVCWSWSFLLLPHFLSWVWQNPPPQLLWEHHHLASAHCFWLECLHC